MGIHRSSGFTLVEVAISLAIIGILAGLSLPIYQSYQNSTNATISANSAASMLRRAQVYSRGANGDSGWGVEVQVSRLTLFKGSAFSTRDTSYDETIELPGNLTASGVSEILFSKLTATPSTTGSIALASPNSTTKTLTINAKGMVNY